MNSFGIPVIERLEPELDTVEPKSFSIGNGGREIVMRAEVASNPSGSYVDVNYDIPAPTSIIDPAIYAEVDYTLTFTGDNAFPAVPILNIGATDAPRQWPLHQPCPSITISMNGNNFTTQPQVWFPHVSRMGQYQRELNTWQSVAPSALDNFQEYYDAANPNQALSVRNPLSDYNGGTQWSLGRGSFPMQIISNTATGAQVRFTTFERLLVSPVFPNRGGLTNVSTFNVNFQMSNLNRIWSHGVDPTRSAVTGLTVTINSFKLRFRIISPKSGFPRPAKLILPYIHYLPISSNPQTIAPGNSAQFVNSSLKLQSTPDLIFVCVREKGSSLFNSLTAYNKTDTCARITNLVLQYGGRNNILGSYEANDLFRMSSANGLNSTWQDFYGSTLSNGAVVGPGSFIIIDVARDIGLDEGDAPGSNTSPQIQITATATNFGSNAKDYELIVIAKTVGCTEINADGSIYTSTSTVSPEAVLEAAANPEKEVHDLEQVMIGGKWYDKVKKGLRKAHRYLQKTKAISKVARALGAPSQVADVADVFGYGVQNARTGRALGGARVY